MASIKNIWENISPLTKGLAVFALVNCAIVNLAIHFLSNDNHTLHYSSAFVKQIAHDDSWVPMRQALQYLHDPGLRKLSDDKPLYDALFFDQQVKFQYPLTSLLFLEPLRLLAGGDLIPDAYMNFISWLMIIATGYFVYRIFELSLMRYAPAAFGLPLEDRFARAALIFFFSFTFYPLVRSFVLGQVQTWIDFLFAAALFAWIKDRKCLTGILAGIFCVIKPQLSLLLLWGIIRKEFLFVKALTATIAVFILISVAAYGWENNFTYLKVVSFIARHGEAYFPNQSVNGLLNRMVFNGNNLGWEDRGYPPYNPWIFYTTVISSALIIGAALFWRKAEHRYTSVIDLMIAVLSFTIASPIAWEHHYGILLPIFAFALPASLDNKVGPIASLGILAISYALCSNYYQFTNASADTWFNFIQSYLLFGAALLLIHLYRLRNVQTMGEVRAIPG